MLPATATRRADGAVVLPLAEPVTVALINRSKKTFAELVFHPLTRKDVARIRRAGRNAGKEAMARLLRLDGKMAKAVTEGLSAGDEERVQAVVVELYTAAASPNASEAQKAAVLERHRAIVRQARQAEGACP